MSECILVAFPNGPDGQAGSMRAFERAVGAASGEGLAEVYHFEAPGLRVGTLEKLMAAGDNLVKVDSSVEGVVRRIERAFGEINNAGEELTVEGEPVLHYLRNFHWAAAKFQATRPIEELIKVVTQTVQNVDDQLKEAMAAYQESKHKLNALQRKRGSNLMANVSEFLQKVDPAVFVDTEFLTHVLIVVPRNSEGAFLEAYERLASDAVGYGPEDDRQKVLGSPVVPGSAQKIAEDKDGFVLFLVVVLKAFKDEFVQAAQKNRFAVRESGMSRSAEETSASSGGGGNSRRAAARAAAAGGGGAAAEDDDESLETQFAAAEIQFEEDRNQLRRWAKTHYGEAFIAWIHIKTIRVFVEAVLLYGLPVDFTSVLIQPKSKSSDKKVRDRLAKLYSSLTGHDADSSADIPMSGGGATSGAAGGAASQREAYYPYVTFTFKPFASE